jgi:hypothetical protein
LVLERSKGLPSQTTDEARAEVTALGIEPRLVLRPTAASHESWEVSLEIPDLSHLILRFPRVREILTGSRCVVAGAAGRPFLFTCEEIEQQINALYDLDELRTEALAEDEDRSQYDERARQLRYYFE